MGSLVFIKIMVGGSTGENRVMWQNKMKRKTKYFLIVVFIFFGFVITYLINYIPKYQAENEIIEVVFNDIISEMDSLYNSFPADSTIKWRAEKKSNFNAVYFLQQFIHPWRLGSVNQKIIKTISSKYLNSHILILNSNDYKQEKIYMDGDLFDVIIKDKHTGEIGEILSIDNIHL